MGEAGGGGDAVSGGTSGNGGDGGGILLGYGRFTNFSSINSIVLGGDNGQDAWAGAGAGGSVVLIAETMNYGTNKFTLTGGLGGSSNTGGDGGTGRLSIHYGVTDSGSNTVAANEQLVTSFIIPVIDATRYSFVM